MGTGDERNLGAPATELRVAVTGGAGERRQATVLFADMAGFTSISERLGEEGTYGLVRPLYDLMRAAVQAQGGTVKDFTGDGIMALFGVPLAFEDAPLRACRAALSIQQRISAASLNIQTKHGVRPQMRIGINTGAVVVAPVGDGANITVVGDTVNTASRLQALAEPGKVLLSETTHRLVQGLVEATFAGAHQVKGKADPQRVYRLDAIRQGAARFDAAISRGLTVYVGRDREMNKLERSLGSLESGIQIVDVVGEPGIGKSRLLHEFRGRVPNERARVLVGSCTSDGEQTPFLPFIEVVRNAFRVNTGEAELAVAHKLEEGLTHLHLYSLQNLGLLFNLLGVRVPEGALRGIDGVLIGLRTRDLLQQLLRARCSLSPLVILLEDLHWIDSASEEVLAKLVASEDPLRLLIIHTRRPEYCPPWIGEPKVTALPLEPLAAHETVRIVQARLGADQLPDALAALVTEKAEGNALFTEEIASFLVERGVVRRGASGLEFDAQAAAAALPASIRALLTARVDRLAPADRKLLQAAAVIGRRFDLPLLAMVVGADERDVASRLSLMEAADLVRHRGGSGDYVFKHVLVRDALYDSLLSAARAELHLKVAREIERHSGQRIVEVAEILAYHYSLADQPDQTFRYLCLAGRKSLDIYSLDESEQYFRQALKVYDTTLQADNGYSMAKAVVGLLETLYLAGNVLETKRVAELHIPRLEKAGPTPELAFALYFLSLMLANLCAFREGEAKARQALAIAEQTGDVKAIAYARSGLFFLATVLGRTPRDAMEVMGAQLLAECEKAGDNYILNWTYWSIGNYHLLRGIIHEARAWTAKLVESGRARKDQRAFGMAYWTLSWIEIQAHRYDEAARYADEALKTAVAPFDRNAASQVKAAVMVLQGRLEEGLERLRATRQWAQDNGWLYLASIVDLSVAPALALHGDLRPAIALLEAGIAANDANGSRAIAAWNRFILAELYLAAVTTASRPPLRVVMRNCVTILYIVLFGARRARTLLAEAMKNEQFEELGTVRAQIELDLGMLARHEKRIRDARDHFARARAAAKAQEAAIIVGEIDAAVATLR